MKPASHAHVLRERLSQKEIVVVPGGGSPLEIKLIARAGFDAAYLSGYATAASRYGVPDIGLVAYGEIENAVLATTRVADVPLIVDCDTGYGDVTNMVRTVQGMERLGVAAIQIEDQAWPKRCGHMDAKIVEPREVALRKLRAALDARRSGETLILARTDALAVEGIEAALERAERYLECGVDALFVEALRTPEHMDAACQRFARRVPLLANMVEGGKTPIQSLDELGQRGFRIVIFPGGTVRAVAHTLQGYYADLQRHGSTKRWQDRMLDFDGLNGLIGTPELLAQGRRYEGG